MKKKQIIACIALLLAGILFLSACGEDEEIELYYSPGEAFVTNIVDNDSLLVKIVVSIGMRRDATEELTAKNAVIRDCILRVIRTTTLDELNAPDMQANMSNTIVNELNAIFPPGEDDDGKPLFTRVYFLDFVIN